MLRRRIMIALAAAVIVLLLAKCVSLWLGAAALSAYQDLAQADFNPSGPVDAAERAELLAKSVRYIPGDDEAWRELARFAFLSAGIGDQGTRESAASVLRKMLPGGDSHDSAKLVMLKSSVHAYDRAIASNALDGGSRFWRVLAQSSLEREVAGSVSGDAVVRNLLDLDRALALDPVRPDRLIAAAEYALGNARPEKAAEYYRKAFSMSLDGLEDAVLNLLFSPLGVRGAEEIVPEISQAKEKLSEVLFDRWHFKEAQEAWTASRLLAGLPATATQAGEYIANPEFRDVPGAWFHDWRIVDVPGVRVERQSNQDRSWLHVEMDKGPANYFHVFQDVPLEPGVRYHFSALVRTEGFEPRTIVGVEIVHPMDPGIFSAGDGCIASPEATPQVPKACSNQFILLEKDFTLPQDLPVVRFRLRRHTDGIEKDSGKGILELTAVSIRPAPPQDVEIPPVE